MKNLHSARWLIAPALFLAFCSKGNAPTISGPSSLPGPPATVTAGGGVGISADGDVKVGTGTLEFLNLSIWGFNGDPGAGGFVEPGGTYGVTPGVEVKLWATYVEGSPANPKFMVDWGDGTEPSAGGCGACKAIHTYAIPGLYTVKASLDDRVSTMVTRTFILDARGSAPTATVTPAKAACFSFTNTGAEDLPGSAGAGWFDNCVDSQTTNVRVTLRDQGGAIVYQATGTKVGAWNFDQLTSTANKSAQYHVGNHDRLITLDNGDLLKISGRSGRNSGCGGDQGNGYVIMVYSALPAGFYTESIKILVAPYRRTTYSGHRDFAVWDPSHEISWNGGGDMNSCFPWYSGQGPLVPFLGTFDFAVF